jgi:nucleoside-diphosphate-sugar epimerase
MRKLENKGILITGGAGFVGSCLARQLADSDNRVGLLVLEQEDLWRVNDILSSLSILKADLRDYSAVSRQVREFAPDVVFHLATYGGMSGQNNDNRIVETNILAAANLLLALRETDYNAFVNVGSSSEYGLMDKPMAETDRPQPVSSYGRSKLAATHLCESYASAYGMPNVTLRLFSPYGPYEDARRLVPSVILSCLKGIDPALGSAESVRDFVFVMDAVDALLEAAIQIDKLKGRIINIGSGIQRSVGEVADMIIELVGNDVRPIWGAVKPSQPEPKAWLADIGLVAELMGWQPRYDLRSGLSKTVEWFRANSGRFDAYRGDV